jgi:hypothetical protein
MNLLGKAKPIKSFAYPKHLAQGCTRCFEKGEANQSLEKVLTQFSTRSGLDKDTTFFFDCLMHSSVRQKETVTEHVQQLKAIHALLQRFRERSISAPLTVDLLHQSLKD